MPYTAKWLLSDDAAKLRAMRHESYRACHGIAATHVVWVEIRANEMTELDAESEEHARKLADHWLKHTDALAVSIRKVKKDGSLPGKCVAVIGRE